MRRLADRLYRRRRRVLWAWPVVVVMAAVLGLPVFGALGTGNDFDDPAAQSVHAAQRISSRSGADAAPAAVALVRLRAPAGSPAGQARIDAVAAALRDPDVVAVRRYRPGGDRNLVSRDGRSTYLLATYRRGTSRAVTDRLQARLARFHDVTLGGPAFARKQVNAQVAEDIGRAEALAFPILFLLSLLVFRSVVAALLPLAVGGTTILVTFVLMRGVNEVNPMSIYALNLINGLGLGLGIDYSLFMVSRFREELAGGRDRAGAVAETLATAGRTVLFSAGTVAAAAVALLVFRQRFLYSMGVGGGLCALTGAAVAVTLLPALLAVLGPRVNAGSLARWRRGIERDAAGERSGFWYEHSRRVMRHPVPVAVGASALLIALGLPFLSIRFTGVDASILPRDRSARVVDDALKREFPSAESAPIYVAAAAPPAAVRAYAARLARLPGVVGPPRVSPGRIDLLAPAPALGEPAKRLVRDVRATRAPFPVAVGGQTAAFLDQLSSLARHLPLALAILAATTMAILFAMTGSVVLPVKALVMNVLTLSAAFGLLVVVFQHGSQGIDSSQPVLLFAIAFGLSTDYGVFLLGRIKELHDSGLVNEEAVALGLQRTGRIVTFAALLFVIAIGAFVTSQIVFIRELGFGTAVAVLIDATIVRALLVPALMRLLGEWN
ncbi:MAG TPA: MMPL family transporter, partial [Solirubrobacteraceae bacterium]